LWAKKSSHGKKRGEITLQGIRTGKRGPFFVRWTGRETRNQKGTPKNHRKNSGGSNTRAKQPVPPRGTKEGGKRTRKPTQSLREREKYQLLTGKTDTRENQKISILSRKKRQQENRSTPGTVLRPPEGLFTRFGGNRDEILETCLEDPPKPKDKPREKRK